MNWKFWKNGRECTGSKPNLPKPREIPDQIGMHLVVNKKMDPDFIWSLKCALKPRTESRTTFDFRLFSPVSAQNARVIVSSYDALDSCPELILFHGRFDRQSKQFEIVEGSQPAPGVHPATDAPLAQPRA